MLVPTTHTCLPWRGHNQRTHLLPTPLDLYPLIVGAHVTKEEQPDQMGHKSAERQQGQVSPSVQARIGLGRTMSIYMPSRLRISMATSCTPARVPQGHQGAAEHWRNHVGRFSTEVTIECMMLPTYGCL